MVRGWLFVVAGCGRIGFDPAGDARAIDANTIDAPTGQVTVTFGETPSAMLKNVTRDTYVSNESGEDTFNFGASDTIRTESDVNERALLAFTLTAIPPTATIELVNLSLTITELGAGSSLVAHPVLEAWDEGTTDSLDGVTNYTLRTASNLWTTPGAGMPGSAGAQLGTLTPTGLGVTGLEIPAAIVQQWVTNPATNHGLMIRNSATDSTRFVSSEGSPATDRPLLTVTYRL